MRAEKKTYVTPAVTVGRLESVEMIADSPSGDGPGAGITPPGVGGDGSETDDGSSPAKDQLPKYNVWDEG